MLNKTIKHLDLCFICRVLASKFKPLVHFHEDFGVETFGDINWKAVVFADFFTSFVDVNAHAAGFVSVGASKDDCVFDADAFFAEHGVDSGLFGLSEFGGVVISGGSFGMETDVECGRFFAVKSFNAFGEKSGELWMGLDEVFELGACDAGEKFFVAEAEVVSGIVVKLSGELEKEEERSTGFGDCLFKGRLVEAVHKGGEEPVDGESLAGCLGEKDRESGPGSEGEVCCVFELLVVEGLDGFFNVKIANFKSGGAEKVLHECEVADAVVLSLVNVRINFGIVLKSIDLYCL